MIYWGDETGIDNCSNCERGFAPKGQPPILPVETKREGLNMFSALSRQGDIRFMLYEDSMNQQRLIQFMERLVRTSNRKVFLILDNLKVHHGKKATAWLDRHRDKIKLFFLPPYAPESNPDEYLNHALKLSVHSGDLPRTKCDIRHKTASFMRTLQHSPDKVSAFFQHNQISYFRAPRLSFSLKHFSRSGQLWQSCLVAGARGIRRRSPAHGGPAGMTAKKKRPAR